MTIMVYRKGSRDGHPFDYKTVTIDDFHAALSHGWLEAPPVAAKQGKGVILSADANEAPTREEMEQKAKQLGIRGVHLMKDATLAAKIAERV